VTVGVRGDGGAAVLGDHQGAAADRGRRLRFRVGEA